MQVFRRSNNPNLVVGIFMLIILAVLFSPNFFPRYVSDIFPEFYSGVPCGWLRRSDNRAFHQSLLGRSVDNPFELLIEVGPFPTQPNEFLTLRITVRNNSMGTVPLIYNETQVSIGDNGTAGLGILFSTNSLNGLFARPAEAPNRSYNETDIRLLGPRQSCVHNMEIPAGNVLVDPGITSGQAQVRAFYRGTQRGVATQPPNTLATPIYPDQGLWIGYAESIPVAVSVVRAGT
jgi:hypothetical protein